MIFRKQEQAEYIAWHWCTNVLKPGMVNKNMFFRRRSKESQNCDKEVEEQRDWKEKNDLMNKERFENDDDDCCCFGTEMKKEREILWEEIMNRRVALREREKWCNNQLKQGWSER